MTIHSIAFAIWSKTIRFVYGGFYIKYIQL